MYKKLLWYPLKYSQDYGNRKLEVIELVIIINTIKTGFTYVYTKLFLDYILRTCNIMYMCSRCLHTSCIIIVTASTHVYSFVVNFVVISNITVYVPTHGHDGTILGSTNLIATQKSILNHKK